MSYRRRLRGRLGKRGRGYVRMKALTLTCYMWERGREKTLLGYRRSFVLPQCLSCAIVEEWIAVFIVEDSLLL